MCTQYINFSVSIINSIFLKILSLDYFTQATLDCSIHTYIFLKKIRIS